jgi:hypothetical protein
VRCSCGFPKFNIFSHHLFTYLKKMADIKFDFKGRDYSATADYAERVKTATTGNAAFPLTGAKLTDLGTKAQGLRILLVQQEQHEQFGKLLTQQLRTARKALEDEIRTVGSLAQGESRGEAAKLLAGGWDLAKAEGTPQGQLPAPENFQVSYGDEFRELDFMFDPVAEANGYYKLQMRAGSNTGWTTLDIPRSTRFSLASLPAGELEFRLCAVGTAGDGEWSPSISKKLG